MEAKFKVGDRVRLIKNSLLNNLKEGFEGFIEDKDEGEDNDNKYYKFDNGYWVQDDEIELIEQPHKEEVGSFMVFVEGRSFPKVKHTLADAHKEAKRLCLKEKRRAHIISTFGCYELSAEFKSEI